MTPDDEARDELASAYLDGMTSPEEAERVDADPDLQGRVAHLRAARDAVAAAGEPPPDHARERAIAAALAAYEEQPGRSTTSLPLETTSLAPPARPSTRRRRWLGAAAAVALAVASVPLVARLGADDQGDFAATSGDVAEDDVGDGGRDGTAVEEAAPSAGADATEGAASVAPVDFGEVADLDVLVAAVHGALLATDGIRSESDEVLTQAPSACVVGEAALGADDQVVLEGAARVAGQPVRLVVVARSTGERDLIVARTGQPCTILHAEVLESG